RAARWRGGVGQGRPLPAARRGRGPPLDLPAASFLAQFEDHALAVVWRLAQRQVEDADRLLDSMRTRFARKQSPLIELRLHFLSGLVAYEGGDNPDPARNLHQVCPHLRKLHLRPLLWEALRCRGWCAARLGAEQAELDDRARQANEVLAELAGSLPREQMVIYLLNKWTEEEKQLLALLNHLEAHKQRVEQAPWGVRPWRRWGLWRQLHEFLDKLDAQRRVLVCQQLEGGGAIAPRPLPLWRRLWGHPRDKATLSFLVLPDRVLLVRAGWFSMDFMVRREVTRLWLRDRVAACHQGHQGAAAELAARLNLAELLGGLGRKVDRLVVVPDDALHGLPFAQFNYG